MKAVKQYWLPGYLLSKSSAYPTKLFQFISACVRLRLMAIPTTDSLIFVVSCILPTNKLYQHRLIWPPSLQIDSVEINLMMPVTNREGKGSQQQTKITQNQFHPLQSENIRRSSERYGKSRYCYYIVAMGRVIGKRVSYPFRC